MAWIRSTEEAEAEGELKEVYADLMQRSGATKVLESRKAMGLRPGLLRAVDGLAQRVSKGATGIGRLREELIAIVVSARLQCSLWIVGHGAVLRDLASADLAVKVKSNFREAGLDPADVAMLEDAEKLTLDPGSMGPDDVQTLRNHGFTDEQILDICAVTAYHNFNVRMADGLGVKLGNGYDHLEAEFRNALLAK